MLLNSNKLLFILILIVSTLITISANNWLGMWMGLEMNLMAFTPLISKKKDKKSSQAMMIYFLTQSIGSIVLLFSVMINSLIFLSPLLISELTSIMIMISILIKVGAAPFHFWLPEMMVNLNWDECMILMTWQKIAPLTILHNLTPNNWFLYLSVVLSAMAGGIGGLNQTSLRKILAFSSINHLGWMMMFMSMNSSWYKYLTIYSILVILICWMFKSMNALFINQLMTSSPSLFEKLTLTITLLSIGGLPPFLGFLPKWMVIQSMISSGLYFIMVVMMLCSLLTLFYYLRLMTAFILSYSSMNKWISYKKPNKLMLLSFLLINLTLPVFMTVSFF
uniref:NADH-ubiquinone oxidoreductase chain 2 n=1 Tax=Leptoglossus membranaceus TaxID=2575657 RepID=A0A4D6X1U8_9HEMI|nr:NADH dehydrogenase subunit 2 [Leptoglossus membranaceus]QCI09352.1 NADH dehydrogenase subunit 2 [Leptoglossus membranaceus]